MGLTTSACGQERDQKEVTLHGSSSLLLIGEPYVEGETFIFWVQLGKGDLGGGSGGMKILSNLLVKKARVFLQHMSFSQRWMNLHGVLTSALLKPTGGKPYAITYDHTLSPCPCDVAFVLHHWP